MDEYIKRKKKQGIAQPAKQTTQLNTLRQVRNQTSDLTLKLQYIQQRVNFVRQTLKQLQMQQHDRQKQANQLILGKSSMQKPQLKTQIFDRNSPQTNQVIQSDLKLGGAQGMASQINTTSNVRQNHHSANEKLQQPSKGVGRKRKVKF